MTTKIDIINGMYSQLRISGLTVQPTPEDLALALDRLEFMMHEFEKARNICVGYKFEDTPDANSPSGIGNEHKLAIQNSLAIRTLADFGKEPSNALMMQARASLNSLMSSTTSTREVGYPRRHPVGSGNDLRYNRYQRYYQDPAEAPNECQTNRMLQGDIDDFVEHFDAYLNDGETVSSYTLEADDGLTVMSQSLATPDVNYRIRADGSNTERTTDLLLEVKIVATTSDGRVTTRIINFQVFDPD
jgi:hypothetical protein